MCQIVAVDFGGTNIRVAFFPTPQPPAAIQAKSPTHAPEGPEAVIERIIAAIESQIPPTISDLRIGIGSPGPLDPYRGIILNTPNLPGWKDIPLQARIAEHFDCPVALGNDADVAALAEWRFGAGQGTRHLIYLTISTGIGGGVIIDGQLLRGASGLAAELGHMTVDPDGPQCGCGCRGHLESVAAGPAIAARASALLETNPTSLLAERFQTAGTLTARDVGEAAQAGDELACTVIEEAGTHIGRHMANLAHAFNPEVFVLGGGVAQIGSLLFDPIEQALNANVMHPEYLKSLRILPAALGDDAGLVGAMVLASQL